MNNPAMLHKWMNVQHGKAHLTIIPNLVLTLACFSFMPTAEAAQVSDHRGSIRPTVDHFNPSTFLVQGLPEIATVSSMSSGDLMCYVTLVDDSGTSYEVGAVFDVCDPDTFVNQRVSLTYGTVNIADCQSAEPCGRTRAETVITSMSLI